jgi:type I restriction enzyme S subunit
MMRLTVDQSRASTPFVWHWLQSEAARDYVKRNAKGTSPTMKKISQGIVANIPFPVGLSLTEQNDIVCRLSNTDAQSGNLLTLHSKTRMQLDAILPSVLSRAFNGEL